MQDDGQIIQRVLAGETSAFRLLVETSQPVVFRFARNIVKNFADAEDLTQDVFVAAYRNLASFDASKARLSTWLLTIARNRCINLLKRPSSTTSNEIDLADAQPAPETVVASREIWQHLDATLELLPFEQRTAFVLAEIQELSMAEIAQIEGVEVGTVKSRLSRARERLRHAMRAWRPDPVLPPRNDP
jgi:RNA polymerase sigma-70 factor (ECF subfamily)